MLGTATEEIKTSDEIWDSSSITALRDQQEEDFGLWGPHEFKMPEEEGAWDNVTTNSPKTLAHKVIGVLSSSFARLSVDVDDETRKKRKKIANTERLANGIIWQADRKSRGVPSGKKLQSGLVSDSFLRGGSAMSVLWYEDEDGKPQCDLKRYDPMFCQWIEGDNEIIWFCHRSYVTERYLKRTYKKQISDGFNIGKTEVGKGILMYTFWDADEWKVAVNGEWLDGVEHNLGYLPVSVRSCGSYPVYQSVEYEDTVRWSWVSGYANVRSNYDRLSRLQSIILSQAKEAGKIKIVGEWDSQASNNQPPEGLTKLGYGSKTRNEIVLFDAAKGQKFNGMVEPPSNQQVIDAYNMFRADDIIATIDPVAYGQMTGSGSGVLAAELRAAALEFIYPFKNHTEEQLEWVAEETTRQFKNNKFSEIEVEGRDSKYTRFSATYSPEDIEERYFQCELVPDRLRDRIQELGAAIEAVKNGMSSTRSAMIDHNLHNDPDLELDFIDQEKHQRMSETDPVYHHRGMAAWWKDQEGQPLAEEMVAYHMTLAAIEIDKVINAGIGQGQGNVEPGMPGGGNGGQLPIGMNPVAQAGKIASEPGTIIGKPRVRQ